MTPTVRDTTLKSLADLPSIPPAPATAAAASAVAPGAAKATQGVSLQISKWTDATFEVTIRPCVVNPNAK